MMDRIEASRRRRRGSRRFLGLAVESLERKSLMAGGFGTLGSVAIGGTGAGAVAVVTVDPAVAHKVGNDLAWLYADSQTRGVSTVAAGTYPLATAQPNASLLRIVGSTVQVATVSQGNDPSALINELTSIGADPTASYQRLVSAYVPISTLGALSRLPDLNFAMAEYTPFTSAGKVDDQATQAMKSDVASVRYGVDGTGVTVGILSDSYNFRGGAPADVASGDLPTGVNVLKEGPSQVNPADEGRGMAQLIHDVAPGSPLAFYTAFDGEADFANGITTLAKPVAQGGAGAKVVTDDVFYFHEPIFQDGIVAQAINNSVANYGITEFSSAGNFARGAYQSAFNAVSTTVAGTPGTYHNFNPGGTADVYQPITLSAGNTFTIDFQWDQPFASESTGAVGQAGSQNSVSLYLYGADKTTLVASQTGSLVGQDPYRVLNYPNPSSSTQTQFYLVIKSDVGAVPTQMKYISLGSGTVTNYATNTGASFGHSGAAGAAGVAAAYYVNTPAYNVTPARLEGFTSAGGTAYYFDAAGNRLGTPDLRQQPRFTSIDGTDTTFFAQNSSTIGLFAFFGTSAAAPHAAAVAALLNQEVPSITTQQIYSVLQNTTIPTNANPQGGYSYDSGFGLIQADAALALAANIGISGTVYRDTNGNGVNELGEPAVVGTTVFLDSNSNGLADTGTSGPLASTNVPLAIPDGVAGTPSRISSSLTVAGLTGRVTKVVVRLSVNHNRDRELGLTLIGPSGIRIPLVTNAGGPGANFINTVFDDAGSNSIQGGLAPFTGTYRPQAALSGLIGEDPNGVWKLEARDYSANNTGTITSWSLTISYADPTATTNAAGQYSFAGLPTSAYYGTFHVRAATGYLLTQPTNPYDFNLAVGSAQPFSSFGVAPTVVTAKVVDDGTTQRSMVRKIQVAIRGVIPLANIQAGAFTLAQTSGVASSFAASVVSATAQANGITLIELRFSGADVIAGSLADGRYTLTIDGSKITDTLGSKVDAAGNGTTGSVGTLNFFRLFGDIDGSAIVDNADLFAFRTAYNIPANYNSAFDFDGNGVVDAADQARIKQRYFKTV